jgi:hypothetical protein
MDIFQLSYQLRFITVTKQINNLSQKILKRQLLSFKNSAKAKLDLKLGVSSAGENTNYSKSGIA